MKLTKFAHSCVLVETPERVGIFDPGSYSWKSGTFEPDRLKSLDDIIITHEHPDHMHLPFIRTLVDKFPEANIVTTETAANLLRGDGLENVRVIGNTAISLFQAIHESAEPLSPPPPLNIGIHYLNQLSHPGDCQHFDESKSVLALPVTGTWGTTARAASLVQELKPEYVLPIHDWNWHDTARSRYYERFNDYCEELGVNFLQPVDGQTLEI